MGIAKQAEDENALSADNASSIDGKNQFTIRHLFLMTIVASIVCGFLSAFIRKLPEEEQFGGAIFLVVSLILIGVILFVSSYRRSLAIRAAGRRLYITRRGVTSWYHVSGIAVCVGTLVFLALMMKFMLSANELGWPIVWNYIYLLWIMGAYGSKYLMSVFFWKADTNSIDVRENGIIYGFYLSLPWKMLSGFKWNSYTKYLMLFYENNFLEYHVPKECRDELEKALLQFLEKKDSFS